MYIYISSFNSLVSEDDNSGGGGGILNCNIVFLTFFANDATSHTISTDINVIKTELQTASL